jgi:SpoVK/Ycf46/Vps4 family AAA+-type ATPase
LGFWGFSRRGEQRVYAYRTMADEKVCDECSALENTEYVCDGDENPSKYFENAEQWDDEVDSWKVNLHPNCRCWLELVDVNREGE